MNEAAVLGQQHGESLIVARSVGADPRDLTPEPPAHREGVVELCVVDDGAEADRVAEQPQRVLRPTLAEALAREQLGLRLGRQVGDVDQVLDHQRVDHVFEHAHEVGVEARKPLTVAGRGSAADEGAHVGVVLGQELRGAGFGMAVQADRHALALRRT